MSHIPINVSDTNSVSYVLTQARENLLRNENIHKHAVNERQRGLVHDFMKRVNEYIKQKRIFIPPIDTVYTTSSTATTSVRGTNGSSSNNNTSYSSRANSHQTQTSHKVALEGMANAANAIANERSTALSSCSYTQALLYSETASPLSAHMHIVSGSSHASGAASVVNTAAAAASYGTSRSADGGGGSGGSGGHGDVTLHGTTGDSPNSHGFGSSSRMLPVSQMVLLPSPPPLQQQHTPAAAAGAAALGQSSLLGSSDSRGLQKSTTQQLQHQQQQQQQEVQQVLYVAVPTPPPIALNISAIQQQQQPSEGAVVPPLEYMEGFGPLMQSVTDPWNQGATASSSQIPFAPCGPQQQQHQQQQQLQEERGEEEGDKGRAGPPHVPFSSSQEMSSSFLAIGGGGSGGGVTGSTMNNASVLASKLNVRHSISSSHRLSLSPAFCPPGKDFTLPSVIAVATGSPPQSPDVATARERTAARDAQRRMQELHDAHLPDWQQQQQRFSIYSSNNIDDDRGLSAAAAAAAQPHLSQKKVSEETGSQSSHEASALSPFTISSAPFFGGGSSPTTSNCEDDERRRLPFASRSVEASGSSGNSKATAAAAAAAALPVPVVALSRFNEGKDVADSSPLDCGEKNYYQHSSNNNNYNNNALPRTPVPSPPPHPYLPLSSLARGKTRGGSSTSRGSSTGWARDSASIQRSGSTTASSTERNEGSGKAGNSAGENPALTYRKRLRHLLSAIDAVVVAANAPAEEEKKEGGIDDTSGLKHERGGNNEDASAASIATPSTLVNTARASVHENEKMQQDKEWETKDEDMEQYNIFASPVPPDLADLRWAVAPKQPAPARARTPSSHVTRCYEVGTLLPRPASAKAWTYTAGDQNDRRRGTARDASAAGERRQLVQRIRDLCSEANDITVTSAADAVCATKDDYHRYQFLPQSQEQGQQTQGCYYYHSGAAYKSDSCEGTRTDQIDATRNNMPTENRNCTTSSSSSSSSSSRGCRSGSNNNNSNSSSSGSSSRKRSSVASYNTANGESNYIIEATTPLSNTRHASATPSAMSTPYRSPAERTVTRAPYAITPSHSSEVVTFVRHGHSTQQQDAASYSIYNTPTQVYQQSPYSRQQQQQQQQNRTSQKVASTIAAMLSMDSGEYRRRQQQQQQSSSSPLAHEMDNDEDGSGKGKRPSSTPLRSELAPFSSNYHHPTGSCTTTSRQQTMDGTDAPLVPTVEVGPRDASKKPPRFDAEVTAVAWGSTPTREQMMNEGCESLEPGAEHRPQNRLVAASSSGEGVGASTYDPTRTAPSAIKADKSCSGGCAVVNSHYVPSPPTNFLASSTWATRACTAGMYGSSQHDDDSLPTATTAATRTSVYMSDEQHQHPHHCDAPAASASFPPPPQAGSHASTVLAARMQEGHKKADLLSGHDAMPLLPRLHNTHVIRFHADVTSGNSDGVGDAGGCGSVVTAARPLSTSELRSSREDILRRLHSVLQEL